MTTVDWVVVAILAVACASGLKQGFFRSVCGLGGLALGLAVAAWNYQHLAASLSPRFIPNVQIADMVAFLLIGFTVIALAGLVGHLFAKAFKLIGLGWLDGVAGGAFGVFQGAAIVTILVLAVVAFLPQETYLIAEGKVSREFFGAVNLSSHITPSELGERIRMELRDWKRRAPEWMHPGSNIKAWVGHDLG